MIYSFYYLIVFITAGFTNGGIKEMFRGSKHLEEWRGSFFGMEGNLKTSKSWAGAKPSDKNKSNIFLAKPYFNF